ncbi:hypothetical protein IGI04_040931 [Brassica rapa subsp. trilocularis]|uniref:FCP1 homology domain-containing protein n=1 Tax=Brassica rapa subsp. trilocularis TaxID=1813537 RepID=A0ABQ7KPB2_BRACM|nr:hypothetical protein IGI04_040931 [Brassica rapa subsp. trilocularis]
MEFVNSSTPRYECLLFDLDDTLYPLSSGLSEACANNIIEFMVEKLGIDEDGVVELNQILYKKYGTSMAGLKAVGYEFDNDEYHRFVHGRLPYENLRPDPVLRNLLLTLPLRKMVFSNGDEVHVMKSLKRLGIEDCFERIISFESLNPKVNETEVSLENYLPEIPVICKPAEIAFEKAFDIGQLNPHTTLFFDDSIRNIQTGKAMGLHTVLVGKSEKMEGSDHALKSIHNMKEAFPKLWSESNNKESERIGYATQISIETSVFTNADKAHAAKIIARLGLDGCFERIISFETLNPNINTESPAAVMESREIFDIISYTANPDTSIKLPKTPVICKPFEGAFEHVFKMTNINPHKTLFFDDSIRNIQTGKRVGLHTVWVGTSHKDEGVDIALEHIHNIREALPELWEAVDDKTEEIRSKQKVAIEIIA